jgi:hypothetical protein
MPGFTTFQFNKDMTHQVVCQGSKGRIFEIIEGLGKLVWEGDLSDVPDEYVPLLEELGFVRVS